MTEARQEAQRKIADCLSDALQAVDKAVYLSMDEYGERVWQTDTILQLWAECDKVHRQFAVLVKFHAAELKEEEEIEVEVNETESGKPSADVDSSSDGGSSSDGDSDGGSE